MFAYKKTGQRPQQQQNPGFIPAKNQHDIARVRKILSSGYQEKSPQQYEDEADSVSQSIPGLSTVFKENQNSNTIDNDRQTATIHSKALSPSVRNHYEKQFAADFSQVQIHHDQEAETITQQHNANALSYGNHIFFNKNKFAPHSQTGHKLLSHELSHVLQQGAAPQHNYSPVDKTTQTASIQRDEAKPAIKPSVKVTFASLKDNVQVSDPTGRNHGITIEKRGDDLYYHIPKKGERKVPRPMDTSSKPQKPSVINSITWQTGNPIFQTAFEVSYGTLGFSMESFRVNFFGEGKMSNLLDLFLRKSGSLTNKSDGLQIEQPDRNIIQPKRPSKFKTAVRYHFPDTPYSLYLAPDRTITIIDDKSFSEHWKLPGRDLVDFIIKPNGKTRITWNDPVGIVSVDMDISKSYFNVEGLGALKTSQDRTTLLAWLKAKGVVIKEKGARFTDNELNAAKQTIESWKGGTDLIKALKANGAAGLTMIKSPQITGGSWNDTTGALKIPADIKRNVQEENNTVIHEMTHALFTANGLSLKKGATIPAHVKTKATELLDDATDNHIDEGPVSNRKPSKPRTQAQWEKALSTNATLNSIWADLHLRYKISDPEQTKDIRGMDVADESRYQQTDRGDPVGHGFDNVNEFVASFVTCSKKYQSQMTATIKKSGSKKLQLTYSQLWVWVNLNFVKLGSKNPYINL